MVLFFRQPYQARAPNFFVSFKSCNWRKLLNIFIHKKKYIIVCSEHYIIYKLITKYTLKNIICAASSLFFAYPTQPSDIFFWSLFHEPTQLPIHEKQINILGIWRRVVASICNNSFLLKFHNHYLHKEKEII